MGGTFQSDGSSPGGARLRPQRAPVAPRVRLLDEGDGGALPIEDRVRALLRRGVRGLVTLSGPPGSGKSTALAHLAAVVAPGDPLAIRDEVNGLLDWAEVDRQAASKLVLVASRPSEHSTCVARLEMAPWGDDDLIEYLIARHRPHCQAVMRKVKSSTGNVSLDGSPELWRMVLDALAADATIPDVPAALRRCLGPLLSDPKMTAGALCLAALRDPDLGNARKLLDRFDPRVKRLVQQRGVQVALASELIVRDLCDGVGWSDLEGRLPQDLVRETARLAAHWPAAVDRLAALVGSNKRRAHAMAASVLLAARPEWRPGNANVPTLSGAYVTGAHWAGVDLHGSDLVGTRLEHADLTRADLHDARAASAVLSRATLRGASLAGVKAPNSNLAGADLVTANVEHADLSGANLHGADLRRARMEGANLAGADLSSAVLTDAQLRYAVLGGANLAGADLIGADLSGAVLGDVDLTDVNLAATRFRGADLRGCHLEGISLPRGDFRSAKLRGCYLTGTQLPGADFQDADLRNTGLADVEWAGADLRGADLRGATFHMGSTRSGLVGSAVPCEGSKTGFYTDDFHDRDFKQPEDIRKANLCGADLRGAKVKGVDFYLVDLRGARYTDKQARHFRRCGAILDEG